MTVHEVPRRRGRPPKAREPPKNARCAIYERVSTDMQAEMQLSIPAQDDYLRGWAKREGLLVVAVFKDEGESAASSKDRPGFQAMLAAAKQWPRPFDTILTVHTDRMARNDEEAVPILKEFRRYDVRIRFGNFDVDPFAHPSGWLAFKVQAAVDEYQRKDAALKTSLGMQKKAELGYLVSRKPPAFFDVVEDPSRPDTHGRPSKKLVPRPELLVMARRRAAGESYEQIAISYGTTWKVVRGSLLKLAKIGLANNYP